MPDSRRSPLGVAKRASLASRIRSGVGCLKFWTTVTGPVPGVLPAITFEENSRTIRCVSASNEAAVLARSSGVDLPSSAWIFLCVSTRSYSHRACS